MIPPIYFLVYDLMPPTPNSRVLIHEVESGVFQSVVDFYIVHNSMFMGKLSSSRY